MSWQFALIVLSCILLVVVSGQAPGDESELCTVSFPEVGINVITDPPNERVLMDTSHYEQLIRTGQGVPPVWQSLDLDSNNPQGVQTEVSIFNDNSNQLA